MVGFLRHVAPADSLPRTIVDALERDAGAGPPLGLDRRLADAARRGLRVA